MASPDTRRPMRQPVNTWRDCPLCEDGCNQCDGSGGHHLKTGPCEFCEEPGAIDYGNGPRLCTACVFDL